MPRSPCGLPRSQPAPRGETAPPAPPDFQALHGARLLQSPPWPRAAALLAIASALVSAACRPAPHAPDGTGIVAPAPGSTTPPRKPSSPTTPPHEPTPAADENPAARPNAPDNSPAPAPVSADVAEWVRRAASAYEPLRTDPAGARLQAIVTCIDDTTDPPALASGDFRADAEFYYPASAIKLVVTAAVLARISAERRSRPGLGWDTQVLTCRTGPSTCTPVDDPSNLRPPHAGTATVGHLVRRVHLVSDNHAYNLLYDVVGHEFLHTFAWGTGFPSLRVHHRMFSWAPEEAQRTSPPFALRAGRDTLYLPKRRSRVVLPPLDLPGIAVGQQHVDPRTRRRIPAPMDFSEKNYLSLHDLHRLLLSVVRPDLAPVGGIPVLPIDEDLRRLLVRAMTEDPNASEDPAYPPPHPGARYYKPLLPGVLRVVPQREVVYANKAGKAYGFHVENAYVARPAVGRAFAATVTVYANENGVINDDRYEYAAVTRPFLADLGEVLARACLQERPVPSPR